MNDNAKKWVEALRSGRFKQGKGRLWNPTTDEYCCLGVASELYAAENPEYVVKSDGNNKHYGFTVEAGGWIGILDPTVSDWLGLAELDGRFSRGGLNPSLAGLNDQGSSFQEIADIIESQPDGMFK